MVFSNPIHESWKRIQKPGTELASFLKKKIQRKSKKSNFRFFSNPFLIQIFKNCYDIKVIDNVDGYSIRIIRASFHAFKIITDRCCYFTIFICCLNWKSSKVDIAFLTILLHELQLPSPLENEQKLLRVQLVESVHALRFGALFVVIVETVVDGVLDKTVNKVVDNVVNKVVSMLVDIVDEVVGRVAGMIFSMFVNIIDDVDDKLVDKVVKTGVSVFVDIVDRVKR